MSESYARVGENLRYKTPKKEINTAGAKIAGGIAGAAPVIIKAINTNEILSLPKNQRSIFELGSHVDPEEKEKIKLKYRQGDANANYWIHNPELTERLHTQQPSVLTIDSLFPTKPGRNVDKQYLWQMSPGRPRNINLLGFYAVSGDVGDYNMMAKNVFSEDDKPYDQTLMANMKNQVLKKIDDPVYIDSAARQGLLGALSLIASVYSGLSLKNEIRSNPNRLKTKSFGRRAFLQGLGALTAGTAVFGTLNTIKYGLQWEAPGKSTFSTNEEDKTLWQTLSAYSHEMPSNVWADGRTAMLVAKHEDAMSHIQDMRLLKEKAKGAVVAGTGHVYKAELYLRNKEARSAAIHSYAKETIKLVYKFIFDRGKFTVEQRADLVNLLLDYFASVDIHHVNDPGIPSKVRLHEYVGQNIRHIVSFKSEEIENAIKSLRPK